MATKAIVYGGPSLAVEIAETGEVAERGTPLDVETSVADRLLQQGNWTEAKPAESTKESK